MKNRKSILLGLGLAALAGAAFAQSSRPLSPAGSAATQVGGKWADDGKGTSRYSDGKWIEIEYSRPMLRGRKNIFGSGADAGKTVNSGAPVWRLGANQTTKLKTEVPITINGKTLAAGSYDLFAEVKDSGWTLIVSTQPTQAKYDPKDKSAIWGSYDYDPKFDVVRAPMTMKKLSHSIDQLTIAFVDMTDGGGALAVAWDTTAAIVPFSLAH
ncbi:MAG: DUF2911 domain-containing protein [Thermoanaerobaculia bacterium]